MTAETAGYPVQFEVDDAMAQNRLSILFRWLLVIPHVIIIELLGVALGLVTLLAWFTIVFVGRYPTSMLRFAIGVLRWTARVSAYAALLTGRYPPFSLEEEGDYPARLVVEERSEDRNRLTTFLRPILIIPHGIVLWFLGLAASFVILATWLIALIAGRVPVGLHNFLVGYTVWTERVNAYGALLVDDYPPFSFT